MEFVFNKLARLVKWHDASLTHFPLRISPLVGSASSMDVIAEDLISREKRPLVRIWDRAFFKFSNNYLVPCNQTESLPSPQAQIHNFIRHVKSLYQGQGW
jgi:hypothetical protein